MQRHCWCDCYRDTCLKKFPFHVAFAENCAYAEHRKFNKAVMLFFLINF